MDSVVRDKLDTFTLAGSFFFGFAVHKVITISVSNYTDRA